jgi:hypothetical protein
MGIYTGVDPSPRSLQMYGGDTPEFEFRNTAPMFEASQAVVPVEMNPSSLLAVAIEVPVTAIPAPPVYVKAPGMAS